MGAPLNVANVRERLNTRRLGAKFHYFAELTSTNSYARELAENGAEEGEVVIAESQTQGRGRLGRRWESPPLAVALQGSERIPQWSAGNG